MPDGGSVKASVTGVALMIMASMGSLSACASAPVVKPVEVSAPAFDASEALRVLAESARAWSAGDLEAFVSVYAEDCLFVTSSGLTRGREAVLSRYRERYPDRRAMGALTLEVIETRPAPPDGLTVAARWILSYPDRPAASGHTLVVFRRLEGAWKIVQDASM